MELLSASLQVTSHMDQTQAKSRYNLTPSIEPHGGIVQTRIIRRHTSANANAKRIHDSIHRYRLLGRPVDRLIKHFLFQTLPAARSVFSSWLPMLLGVINILSYEYYSLQSIKVHRIRSYQRMGPPSLVSRPPSQLHTTPKTSLCSSHGPTAAQWT